MLIMLILAQINNLNNNPVPLIIINLNLDLLSNVLGVLRTSFHLIKKKIHGEGIINIPIL